MSQRALEISTMGFSLRKKTTINFGDICVEQTSVLNRHQVEANVQRPSQNAPQYLKQPSRSESIGKSSPPLSPTTKRYSNSEKPQIKTQRENTIAKSKQKRDVHYAVIGMGFFMHDRSL